MVALVGDDGAQIAGYPLVRALRRDAEREVWVAADEAGGGGIGCGVEIHRSLPGADAVIAREAEALLAVEHPHLVPILDVATDGGAVLVRPLLPYTLGEWLVQRCEPAPGEAVTALAPIAAALGALHASGACAGGCSAQAVRLDGDGAPLLLGEGAHVESERPTVAWREESVGVAADVEGWRHLAVAVLEACGAALPAAVERALTAHDLAAAADALLGAWPALPLALEAAEPGTTTAAPARGDRMRRRERAAGLEAVLARVALLTERVVLRVGPIAARMPASLAAVRPRFWAIAGVGVAALIVTAVVLLPTGAADAGGPEAGGDATTPAEPAAPASAAAEEQSPAPVPEPARSTDAGQGGGFGPGVDPVTAVAALLVEREACIDAADAACLVSLHEPDSPQLTAAEPWRMPGDGTLELVQRLGDAWLLRVASEHEPASVLAMSTEAGWTLRDAWSE